MLAVLTVMLPVDIVIAAVATVVGRSGSARRDGRPAITEPTGRTVLLTGGKMTKALALARAFHRAGNRVVLVESDRYRWSGHRFSNCVDAFHVVPTADDPGYPDALATIVAAERVDVVVPVSSPLSSRHDAVAATRMPDGVATVHADVETVEMVDDKDAFAASAEAFGLRVPETHRVTSVDDVLDFDFGAHPERRYILKSIPYDPVHRNDLTELPLATPADTERYVRTLPISPEVPWVLQEFVAGEEYCTHSTVRDGVITVWACCRSSAKQLNYEMVDRPAIAEWVRRYTAAIHVTGQLSFDFIVGDDGEPVAIECNPRTHSAITMFTDEHALAAAYLDAPTRGGIPLVPAPDSRPTYWLHMELWRLVRHPSSVRTRIDTLVRGRDAMLDPRDPLPFILVPHLQIAGLLIDALRRGTPWVSIDVNIGKLVEPGGD